MALGTQRVQGVEQQLELARRPLELLVDQPGVVAELAQPQQPGSEAGDEPAGTDEAEKG